MKLHLIKVLMCTSGEHEKPCTGVNLSRTSSTVPLRTHQMSSGTAMHSLKLVALCMYQMQGMSNPTDSYTTEQQLQEEDKEDH